MSQLLAFSYLQLMDAIRRLHNIIEENINFETLIPFLNKYKIFTTGEMKYFINKLHSDADKVANLVIWLEAKNEKGIYDFVRALNEAEEHSGHIVILEHLQKEFSIVPDKSPDINKRMESNNPSLTLKEISMSSEAKDLMMEHVSSESYSHPNEWKFVDTVKINHLPPHNEKINCIKDFPVAVFSVVTPDKESQLSYSPTVPNLKTKESMASKSYMKVRISIPHSDHHIFEISESDNMITLLCIMKNGTQFEKILSEILNTEHGPLDDLKKYMKEKNPKNASLLFIRPFPIENAPKEKVKSKPVSFEEVEPSAETKTDMLKKACKEFLEKHLDKLKGVSIKTELGKPVAEYTQTEPLAEYTLPRKVSEPYTASVVEEREQKATYLKTMCHVSNQLASPDTNHPDWNEVQVTEAIYPQYHGNLLLGLPVAGFTITPLGTSIYPFLGDNGKKYYQVTVPINPNEYYVFRMHESPYPAQLHLLCIRNDPNDPEFFLRISWFLGNRLITSAEIENYFQRNTEKDTYRKREDGTVKIVYFIEKVNIKKGNWCKVEKENYDFGVPQDAHQNMTNIELLEAWITRQKDRVIMEFITVVLSYVFNHTV